MVISEASLAVRRPSFLSVGVGLEFLESGGGDCAGLCHPAAVGHPDHFQAVERRDFAGLSPIVGGSGLLDLVVVVLTAGVWRWRGCTDQAVRIWSTESARVQTVEPDEGRPRSGVPILMAVFSPDGQTLAIGGDEPLTLWDSATLQHVAVLDGDARIVTLDWSPDGKFLATSSSTGEIRLRDLAEGRSRVIPGSGWCRSKVKFSPDGRTLAFGETNGEIQLWDLETGTRRSTLQGPGCGVSDVAFSADCETVIASSISGPSRLWELSTGKEKKAPRHASGCSSAVAYSPDGRWFAAAWRDGIIHLWDVAADSEIRQLQGHTSSVTALAWSPDGIPRASARYDPSVRLWDANATP